MNDLNQNSLSNQQIEVEEVREIKVNDNKSKDEDEGISELEVSFTSEEV